VKVTKPEAEKAIRSLATKWFKHAHPGISDRSTVMPSFEDFVSWARDAGYGHNFEFRSSIGQMEDAELWFDQELKQTWRN